MKLRSWLAAVAVLTVGAGGALAVELNASATTNQAAAVTNTTINDRDAGVTYTDTWGDCIGNCTLAADGTFRWTATVGAAVSFSFTGNQINLFGEMEPWSPIATVSIDNGTPVNVDYYANPASATTVQVYSSPTLTQGTHALKLTMTNQKNPASTPTSTHGASITFDKAVVTSGTTTTPPPTTAPPTSTPPSTRVSGLAWSSGVWADNNAGNTNNFVTTARGGVNADNFLVYTDRHSFNSQNNPTDWRARLPAGTAFNPAKQDLVLALTTWTADNQYMTGAQGQTIGTSLCMVDTTPIVRIDWEMNLPDTGGGQNGAQLTSSNLSSWTARFNAVAAGIKHNCPGARIDFNPNHGPDQTDGCNGSTNCTRQAFQAVKANVDIYGVDTYDTYPPVKADNSGWGMRLNNPNELDDARKYAIANGKTFSVPEWGVWCVCNPDPSQKGGDDPKYIEDMVNYFHQYAANMAYETYFNETAPYIVSDLVASNPNSRAKYKSLIQGYVGH
jgi:hypothetical protein